MRFKYSYKYKNLKKKNMKQIKNISLERLEELIKAVNTLGSLGVEVKLKITVEIDGKKVEL